MAAVAVVFAARALWNCKSGFDRIAIMTATVFVAYNAFLLFTYVAHFGRGQAVSVVAVDGIPYSHAQEESGLMLASHTLVWVGVPLNRVVRRVRAIRDQRYGLLRGLFHGASESVEMAEEEQPRAVRARPQPQHRATGREVAELGGLHRRLLHADGSGVEQDAEFVVGRHRHLDCALLRAGGDRGSL